MVNESFQTLRQHTPPADAIDTKGPADAIAPAATETKKVHVKKIYIEEVEYLLSISNNLLYNSKTKEAIGLWDSATNTIKELPEEEEHLFNRKTKTIQSRYVL